MKKVFKLIFSLFCFLYLQIASASPEAAKINIQIKGAVNDNRYFLCMPDVGCLSILSAQKGKIYYIYHTIEMHNIYITNLQNFRVNGMGLPSSCHVTVEPQHTIHIYGNITHGPKDSVYINQLHCNVT